MYIIICVINITYAVIESLFININLSIIQPINTEFSERAKKEHGKAGNEYKWN